jgi:hypothetical protein
MASQKVNVSRDKRDAASDMSTNGRKTSDRILDRSAIIPMQKAYDFERDRTISQAKKSFRGQLNAETSSKHRAQLLKILESRASDITDKMRSILKATSREAVTEGMRHAQTYLSRFLGKPTLLDDPIAFAKIRRKIESILAKERDDLLNEFADTFNKDVRSRIVGRSNELDPQVKDLIEVIEVVIDESWWRVERMARTEVSTAYNLAIQYAIEAVSKDFNIKIWLRWCELIDEKTQLPLDAHVAGDSMILHGQVALPGALFTMPIVTGRDEEKEAARFEGQSWNGPPNRPNDRAVLSLWTPDTGLMAYVVRNGKRVFLNT